LPLGGAIRGDSSACSPNVPDEQSSENAENPRAVNVVAPTGFEPVFTVRHALGLLDRVVGRR